MYVIAGLGNPGARYETTRHNAGYLAAEWLRELLGAPEWKSRFQGQVSQCCVGAEQVLLVRPGITDYASIAYRNENDLLAGTDDPEKMYIEQIMPDKIELNMKYLREISPLADIRLIFKTIIAVVKG